MEIISSPLKIQQQCLALKKSQQTIGLVPTMGYLHEGHLSLVRTLREQVDLLVVSIFVNPAQFGPTEDLSSYPRDLKRDLDLCQKEGADIIFTPSETEIYPPGYSTYVEETQLSQGLCGATRPGHFRGVTTVVLKLFNLIQPDVAAFGSKDYQQARVIEKMIQDLNLPIRIVIAPIVREPDGLALSSRNKYLSPNQRRQALCLSRSLALAKKLTTAGERSWPKIIKAMREMIDQEPEARIDYIEARDAKSLEPVTTLERSTVLALAVFIGSTRLIDNTVFPGTTDSATIQ